jgi:hypothetical protein
LKDTLANVRRLWELCEPGAVSQFPVLDRYLLRLSLELAFRNAHAYRRTRAQAKSMFARQVQMMLRGLSPSELSTDQWNRFLTYGDLGQTPKILIDAGGTAEPDHSDHSNQVLARAFLLLRIATGACQQLIVGLAGMNRSELEFWWLELGECRGLWRDGEVPISFADLWSDVSEALRDLEAWMAMGVERSHNDMWSDMAGPGAVLSSSERAALWGLGL